MVPSYDDTLGFFPRVARIRDATGADSLGTTAGTDRAADSAPASIGDSTLRPVRSDGNPSVSSRFPV